MKTVLYLCIAVFITACQSAQPAAKEKDTLTVEHIATDSTFAEEENALMVSREVGGVNIHFADKALVFICYLTDPTISENADTIFIRPSELGETLAGTDFRVRSDSLTDIEIEQSHETIGVFSIQGETQLFENWKKYRSGWQEVSGGKGELLHDYHANAISEEEDKRFPEVTVEDWKAELKRRFGEGNAKRIKDNQSLEESGLFVTTYAIYFRLTGEKNDGTSVTKYIVFYPAIGC